MIDKIYAQKMKDNILDAIRQELDKFSLLSNTSLAYYGAEIDFKIDLKLYSRGEQKESITRTVVLGATEAPGAVETKITIQGSKTGGKTPVRK